MNQFGFNINLKNSPDEILELGKSMLGTQLYHAIEVTYYENMQDTDTHAYNHAIRKIVEAYHPRVLVHISGFDTSEENSVLRSAIVHEFIHCCQYTRALGGHEIILHTGSLGDAIHVPLIGADGGRPSPEQVRQRAWDLCVQMFRVCCDIAKEYGVTVHTENLNGNRVTLRCEELNRFITDVARDNLDIVFDIGHCHHTGGEIVPEVLEAGKRLHHLHLHDNFGERDQHMPLGEGNIDYQSFVDALKQVEYDGLYLMELYHCTPENLLSSRERILECL